MPATAYANQSPEDREFLEELNLFGLFQVEVVLREDRLYLIVQILIWALNLGQFLPVLVVNEVFFLVLRHCQ